MIFFKWCKEHPKITMFIIIFIIILVLTIIFKEPLLILFNIFNGLLSRMMKKTKIEIQKNNEIQKKLNQKIAVSREAQEKTKEKIRENDKNIKISDEKIAAIKDSVNMMSDSDIIDYIRGI